MLVGALIMIAVAAAVYFVTGHAHAAGPPEKWAQVDPAVRDWFRTLQNGYGTSCCDFADGNRVDDAEWRQDSNGEDGEPRYSVKLFDQWWPVDPMKVLKGTNRVGYAILWRPQVEKPQDGTPPPIYCFIPGQTY